MKDYPFGMDSQVNFRFVSIFFLSSIKWPERDYTNNFTTNQIFPSYDDLIEWVQGIVFHLRFVVITIRSIKAIGEPRRHLFY